ncbi:MAG: hypothetical protein HRF42_04585 [Candidatus Brocadia sp.]
MFTTIYLCLVMVPLLTAGLMPFAAFSQNYVINGIPEKKGQEIIIKDSIVRRKSLFIKDNRIYIRLVIDEGARNITNHKRYKETLYLLPKEIVYDEISRRIFYYTNNTEIEIGREKSFFGLMPYIALANGVTIMGSPTDAKLLISSNSSDQGILQSVIHSEESMEATLDRKCGQCHILEYIFSHKNWSEEDILHAFNRMQMEKEERFTQDEQKIIDLFKKYQRGEIDRGKLAEFKSLKEISKNDIADFTEGVYMNNCVPCHNPLKISDVSLLYSKRRCKSIVDRMKEKEPSLFLQKDLDSLAGYLWEIKLKPYGN